MARPAAIPWAAADTAEALHQRYLAEAEGAVRHTAACAVAVAPAGGRRDAPRPWPRPWGSIGARSSSV